jgi:subtilisin family serine protease
LDVGRIAVLRATEGYGAEDLSPYGLDGSAEEPMAVRGWSFVRTTPSIQMDAGIARAVSQIAGEELVEFVSPVFGDEEGGPIVITPHILVGFDRSLDAARAEAILAESQAGEILDRDWANMKRTYRLRSSSRDGFEVLEAANALARRPDVTFAEPDMMVTVHEELIPDDTYFPSLWGLHNDGTFGLPCTVPDFDMDAPEAWEITTGDPSILVAILDSGVQLDHPDLNLYTPGFDATGEGGGGGPVNVCDKHGTAVAGSVSGIMNNGLGIAGVAPGVQSASARMFVSNLNCSGNGTVLASWVVAALAWADSIGARITNSSWGNYTPSSAQSQKFADTRANGIVHFAAAGNDASSTIAYPAAYPSVNAVAALEPCGDRAPFSNYGVGLDFSAPGHFAISTDRTGADGYNDGVDDGGCLPSGLLGCNSDADCGPGESCFLVSTDYALVAGTSFASPSTAGVAALALSARPNMSADQLEGLLQQTAVDLGQAGYDTAYGWGFVNAYDAVLNTDIVSVADAAPSPGTADFALGSNRPNPFAGRTRIGYDLTRESTVQLRILDVSGRIVRATPAHFENSGPHEFLWDGTDGAGSRVPPGMYFYELRVNGASQTRKAVLLH